VSWTNTPTTPYNNRVWIWIDFCPVNGVTPQSFSTATITSPNKTGGNGTITGLNGRGFFIEYSTTNAGTTVTATLSNAPAGKFNWCVYGSDYPPNATINNGTYTLKGTPPFTLVASDGTTTQTVSGTTLATSALTITPTVIRDMTGCPGVFCPYTGSDLYLTSSYPCQQRTSGAKNWQAYIRDSRDSEIYRIVLMPDTQWWLAQNVKYASTGSAISGCTKNECGRYYTWAQAYASYAGGSSGSTGNVQGICPPGWLLPIQTTYSTLATSIGSARAVCKALRSYNAKCTTIDDTYGWASIAGVLNGDKTSVYTWFYTNDAGREDGFGVDYTSNCNGGPTCDQVCVADTGENNYAVIRCYRQL
jgi:uncharacterized protein (TIGR02145 family)